MNESGHALRGMDTPLPEEVTVGVWPDRYMLPTPPTLPMAERVNRYQWNLRLIRAAECPVPDGMPDSLDVWEIEAWFRDGEHRLEFLRRRLYDAGREGPIASAPTNGAMLPTLPWDTCPDVRQVPVDGRSVVDILDRIADPADAQASRDHLASLVRRLEVANRDIEQFAYATAHDLREPLRLVSSHLGLLRHRHAPALPEEAHEYIGYACEAVAHMDRLTQALLRFIVAGHGWPAHPPRPLDDALKGALAVLDDQLADSQARIETLSPLPATVLSRIDGEQIFTQLIDNAVKFRHPDRAPRVRIEATEHSRQVVVTVSDNGMGMEPNYAASVFHAFRRLHGRGDFPGTGIGLAIVRKIVESRRGRIWLTSEAGRGTRVHFTVPRTAADPPAAPLDAPALPPRAR